MYYADLTFYRINSAEHKNMVDVFPEIINIGWLDKNHSFPTGKIPPALLQKLKQLTLIDLANYKARKVGSFDEEEAVIVHCMQMRGLPELCPFCPREHAEIWLDSEEEETDPRFKKYALGTCQIQIPSADGKYLYASPSLLYHYVAEHDYLPPSQFLEALEAFGMNKPFNIEETNPGYKKISIEALKKLDEKIVSQKP